MKLYHTSSLVTQIGDFLLPANFRFSHKGENAIWFFDKIRLAEIHKFDDHQSVIYETDFELIPKIEKVRAEHYWKTFSPVPFSLLRVIETNEGPEIPGLRFHLEHLLDGKFQTP